MISGRRGTADAGPTPAHGGRAVGGERRGTRAAEAGGARPGPAGSTRGGGAGSALWRRGAVAGTALAALAVVLATGILQWRTAGSIPFEDQWGWFAQYRGIAEHGLTPADLLDQWNEHRLVFPRLVFLLDIAWAKGTNAVDLAASDLLQGLTLAVIVGMGRSALRCAPGAVAVAFAVMLLASAAQGENLYAGFQVQFVMVYAAAVAATALAASAAGRPAGRLAPGRLLASWCAATVATFSMANGIGTWPVMVLLLLLGRGAWPAVATAAAGAVEIAVYLHGYHGVSNPDHTGLAEAAGSIWACTSYLLAYLGAILAPTDAGLARLGGCAAVALGFRWAWRCRRVFAGPDPWPRFAAGVLLFVLFSAAVTAVGRFRFGDGQALSSRYLTPGAVLWSVLALAVAIEAGAGARAGVRTAATVALACLAVVVGVGDEVLGVAVMSNQTAGMPLASDAYVVGVRDPAALDAVTPNIPLAWSLRPFLQSRGLGPFADAGSDWLGRPVSSLFAGRTYVGCVGGIDDRSPVGEEGGEGLHLDGWAWGGRDGLPSRLLAADAAGAVVGLARPGVERPDVRATVPGVASDLTGFQGYARAVPGGTLRLFAVSHDGRSVCEVGTGG